MCASSRESYSCLAFVCVYRAEKNGGCLSVPANAEYVLDGVSFIDCQAGVSGGAVANDGTLTYSNGYLRGNTASTGWGGALYSGASSTVTVWLDGMIFHRVLWGVPVFNFLCFCCYCLLFVRNSSTIRILKVTPATTEEA